MKETELGKVVKEYFQGPGHEVFCEVMCNGIIDVVVKCGVTITAIEIKTTFGLAVIDQAIKNKNYAHYSYVAVPKVSNRFAEMICRDYGIGILIVNLDGFEQKIREQSKPRLNRRIIKPRLTEYQKLNDAGVQNERWTSFKWLVDNIKQQLRRNPNGLTHKELFDACSRHYNNATYLKRNLMAYIRSGVIQNVEYKDKKFYYAK